MIFREVQKRKVVQAILFMAQHIVVPFVGSFGLALILYGIVLGLGDYSKFWHVFEGLLALALSYLILLLINKRFKKN